MVKVLKSTLTVISTEECGQKAIPTVRVFSPGQMAVNTKACSETAKRKAKGPWQSMESDLRDTF